uniref:SFRICE_013678 n=1 Tax=Spodoptera frugiperda TaxID=7108 RepID=A0A2H1VKB8_SPOFR
MARYRKYIVWHLVEQMTKNISRRLQTDKGGCKSWSHLPIAMCVISLDNRGLIALSDNYFKTRSWRQSGRYWCEFLRKDSAL